MGAGCIFLSQGLEWEIRIECLEGPASRSRKVGFSKESALLYEKLFPRAHSLSFQNVLVDDIVRHVARTGNHNTYSSSATLLVLYNLREAYISTYIAQVPAFGCEAGPIPPKSSTRTRYVSKPRKPAHPATEPPPAKQGVENTTYICTRHRVYGFQVVHITSLRLAASCFIQSTQQQIPATTARTFATPISYTRVAPSS